MLTQKLNKNILSKNNKNDILEIYYDKKRESIEP